MGLSKKNQNPNFKKMGKNQGKYWTIFIPFFYPTHLVHNIPLNITKEAELSLKHPYCHIGGTILLALLVYSERTS